VHFTHDCGLGGCGWSEELPSAKPMKENPTYMKWDFTEGEEKEFDGQCRSGRTS
jgi:hypothetical protein